MVTFTILYIIFKQRNYQSIKLFRYNLKILHHCHAYNKHINMLNVECLCVRYLHKIQHGHGDSQQKHNLHEKVGKGGREGCLPNYLFLRYQLFQTHALGGINTAPTLKVQMAHCWYCTWQEITKPKCGLTFCDRMSTLNSTKIH